MNESKIKKIFLTFRTTLLREWTRIIGSPVYLIGSFGVMIFCFIFFLTLFNDGLPNNIPIAVVDLDKSVVSRQFVKNLDATQTTHVKMHLDSYSEARREMQKGNIYAFLVLNDNFESNMISNRQPAITFYINDSYLIAGSLLLKDITYMSELSGGALKQQSLLARGVNEKQIMSIIQPVAVESHLLGNPWANYGVYLLNVILPGILQLMIIMLTVYSIGIEFKERTSHIWMQNANNSTFVALTAKMLPYTLIFTLLGFVSNIILANVMHYPMNSNIGYMFLTTFLYVIASQSIGIFIIGTLPVLRDGIAITALYGLLGFTFAGFTFPIEQMAYPVQIFSHLFPIRHYFKIYVNQALFGTPIGYSTVHFLALLLFLVLPFFVYFRIKNAAIKENYPIK